jgi:pyruvate dehydrogenase E1 component beta subunit
MAELTLREALRRAMTEEMRRDDRVFLMGEEVAQYDGAYKVSQGMLFTGLGIGAAMAGLRPIIEFMTWNFSLVAYDQIIHNAAKVFQMTGGTYKVPIVFRGPNGAAENLGSQHSQSLESLYAHFPGLKVISTCIPKDAYGLLKTAIRDDDPVVFMESELYYGQKGEVPDEEFLIPFGLAETKRPGKDVTLVTWNKQVFTCLDAAKVLAEQHGIDARVIDLRSIRPLDEETLYRAAVETHRMVVVQEGFPFAGVGAEIVARVQEACFDALDAPILRVTNRDVPSPYATNLEKLVMPNVERVVDAVRTVVGR